LFLTEFGGTTNITAFGNFNPNGTGNWTQNAAVFHSGAIRAAEVSYCTLQTTAANITAGSITVTGGDNGGSVREVMVAFNPIIAPVFSVVPAFSSNTTTSITFSFTTNQDGTVKGVAVSSGASAPSVAQIKAGQDSTGAAATATISTATTATVGTTGTFSLPGAPGLFDFYFVVTNGNGDSAASSVIGAYEVPAYDSGLSLSSATTDGGVIAWDADAASTSYVVAVIRGSSAPSCTQIKAGQNGSSAAALAAGNKSTGTSSDSLTLTGITVPVVSYYGCLHNTGGDSSVSNLTGQCISPAAGRQFINCPTGLTSIGTGSPCAAFNAATNPDLAAGDILNAPTTTSPGSFALTIGNDCHFSYSGDASRQSTLNISIYDDSVGAYHADDIDFWSNDPTIITPDPNSVVFYIPLNTPMTPINLSQSSLCVHPLGDHVTYTSVSSLPAGISIAEVSGDSTLQGTATVRALNRGLTWRCTSALTGASVDWQ
jgi:hypothetical protein